MPKEPGDNDIAVVAPDLAVVAPPTPTSRGAAVADELDQAVGLFAHGWRDGRRVG